MTDATDFESLGRYDSATIANAIESFDVRPRTEGFADSTIRCMYPALAPIVGRVVTCRLENSESALYKPNVLLTLLDLLRESPEPTVVVCAFAGEDPERSCLVGDLISSLLQRLGTVGVVTDCGTRDIDMIARRAPGFQVFASGVVASHGAGTVVEIGRPVTIGGLTVSPGDIIHGDLNGVVAIPSVIAARVPEAAAKVLAKEEALHQLIRAEEFDYQAVRNAFSH